MRFVLASIAVVALTLLASSAAAAAGGESSVAYNGGLSVKKAVRSINVQTHIEETFVQFDVANDGSSATDFILVPINAEKAAHLSMILARQLEAADKKSDDDDDDEADTKPKGIELKPVRVTVTGVDAPAGTVFYKLPLKTPLNSKDTTSVGVNMVFTRTVRAHPSEIGQADTPLVLFTDSLYPYSAYKTAEAVSQVKVATDKIESHTKKSATVKGETIEYGPFDDLAAFATAPLSVHFESEYPFVTMTSVRKLIEVSHYGNINVEEHYVLQNTGARLKGGFSRYDYQRQQQSKSPAGSFRQITALLPASATNIYYRDQVRDLSNAPARALCSPLSESLC
jgi:oligosaccharyltransferase complex subunit alpha (ribophorin I)